MAGMFGTDIYTNDYPVERMMRDAKITQIYEGIKRSNASSSQAR